MDATDDEEHDFPKYQLSTTDDEENDVAKYPIDTYKPSPSAEEIIETDLPSPTAEVPVIVTIAPVEIVTRSPIEKEKTVFQPVTTTVFPIAKVPASLSSIYVLRKPSPVTTDYITTSVEIDGRDFDNDMFRGYPYKILQIKCAEQYLSCLAYFMLTSNFF